MDNSEERSLYYAGDYGLDEVSFTAILHGRQARGRLNQDWAAQRLLEYAPYDDIVRLLGFHVLVKNWPRWRSKVASFNRRRGLDFLTAWLEYARPDEYGRPADE